MAALLQFLFFATNDLDLVKDILKYHDSAIRKVCFVVVMHHSWYLSEHLISLSLFDFQPERFPLNQLTMMV